MAISKIGMPVRLFPDGYLEKVAWLAERPKLFYAVAPFVQSSIPIEDRWFFCSCTAVFHKEKGFTCLYLFKCFPKFFLPLRGCFRDHDGLAGIDYVWVAQVVCLDY